MNDTRYGMRVELPVGCEEATEQATAALNVGGSGVLTKHGRSAAAAREAGGAGA